MFSAETDIQIRDLMLLLNPPTATHATRTLRAVNVPDSVRDLFLNDCSIEEHAKARYRTVQTLRQLLERTGRCPIEFPPSAKTACA